MWTSRRKTIFLATLVLSLLFFACSSELGFCSEAAAGTAEETVTVSMKDWIALKENNAAQKKALDESTKELSEVKKALDESNQASAEARILLEASQMTSDEMTLKLIALSEESKTQKAEIEKLKNELRLAKTESMTAYEAIVQANQYLSDTREEIKAREAEWQKREAQLEKQRLLWQILTVVVGGAGVAIAS